jgi:hypothetical protein
MTGTEDVSVIEQDQEINSPAWFVSKRTRLTWQNELTKAQARLSQLERRSERVGEIAQASSLYADSLLNEFML